MLNFILFHLSRHSLPHMGSCDQLHIHTYLHIPWINIRPEWISVSFLFAWNPQFLSNWSNEREDLVLNLIKGNFILLFILQQLKRVSTFSIFKSHKNAALTTSLRFYAQNFIYILFRETRIFKITKKCYYQACKLFPCGCLISQDVRRKQSMHCCEKQYLNENRFSNVVVWCFFSFSFFFNANPCSITHVWTFVFKSFHFLVSLALPNTLQAISWQELKHFISVKHGKFSFILHSISFALLPKYRYYNHVIWVPRKQCMAKHCKQSCRAFLFFRNNTELSKNISRSYFWFNRLCSEVMEIMCYYCSTQALCSLFLEFRYQNKGI